MSIIHDLKNLLESLTVQESAITEIYLFGSRAYGTGSLRSDCDLLVRAMPDASIKSSKLRDFALKNCKALDLFLCTEARATSAANDSFVHAGDFERLVSKLDAVKIWTRPDGFLNFGFKDSGDWTFEVSEAVDFQMTCLPNEYLADWAWTAKLAKVEASGLPTRPFLGDSLSKVADQIVDVARRMIFEAEDLGQRGVAKAGWTVDLKSEYDCQNLFFTVVSPWLVSLEREQIAIKFDDQKKQSDFSLVEGRLIIEMKWIDTPGKKAEVVKTLDGLARFYASNSNVGGLLFIIFVKRGVAIGTSQWEDKYSFPHAAPFVRTVLIEVP